MAVAGSRKSLRSLVAATTVLGVGLLLPAGSVAISAGAAPAAAGAGCVDAPASARERGGGDGTDPNSVSAADTAAMERTFQAGIKRLPQARALARGRTPVLPRAIKINTYIHVITRSDGTGDVTNAQIAQQMKVLDTAFSGKTSRQSAPTLFAFTVKSIDRTRNDDWYDWGYPGDEETPPTDTDDGEAKTALHKGGWKDLNIYIAGLGDGLLGYATFPTEGVLALDGLVLLNDSLPGGSAAPYNEGDTATHELGHWLFLLHTFENGCVAPGDEIFDTPAQDDGDNIFECTESLDTCPAPGRDPVHNFMSYGDDPCLDSFTPGQSLRMTLAWLVFRAGR